MKKTILLLTFIAITSLLAAQTIVSTDPENRDAVLEEFTGRECVYCPEGHQIAEGLKTQHGDDFWIINLHAGGFSPTSYPNLNAPHSNNIRAHFGVNSFPSGTINRHNWGQGVVHSRGTWGTATTSALANPAYCNVGVEASIDQVTRIVTVNVEVYYTANSPVSSNYLSVAILGNGVIGNQSGGGSNYVHNHFLIEMINENGPWGDEITTTSQGNLYAVTYTWVLPETLPIENGPELDPTTLEVVAFVTQDDKDDIINADGGEVASTPLFADDVAILDVMTEERTCDNTITPSIVIKNGGTNALTACEIEYSVNGGTPSSYSWTGNLGTLESEEIELPEIEFILEEINDVNVEAILTGDGNTNNNSFEVSVDEAPLTTKSVTLHIEDGLYIANLDRWELINSAGTIVQSGENYASAVNEILDLVDNECYDLYIYHVGSGFVSSSGHMSLIDSDGQVLGYIEGAFGSEAFVKFQTGELETGVEERRLQNLSELKVFPNPSNGKFSISFDLLNASNVCMKISDITGKQVYNSSFKQLSAGQNNISIEDTQLNDGLYFLTIETKDKSFYQKIQILK